MEPPYAPNVVNQTVSYGGITWKGNPGGGWVPEGGGGGGDATGQYIQNAVQKLDDAYFSKIKEFNSNNPFVYDEVLKQEINKAGVRLDPYYQQSLNDYMKGIDLQKSRSLEDQRKTLGNLNADINSYTEENRQNLDAALEKSRQGYADVGLYTSGAQEKNTARQGLDSNQNLQNYMTGKDQQIDTANTANTRTQEDANLKLSQYNRDVGSYDANGKFKRGVQSEEQVRSQAIGQIPINQSQRQFALNNYVGPAPGQDPNLFYLNNYSNLQ